MPALRFDRAGLLLGTAMSVPSRALDRSHVKAVPRRDFLALGNVFQHFAYVSCGRDGDRKTVVELRVVPIHFRKSQHLLSHVLERLSQRLTPQLERAGHVHAGVRTEEFDATAGVEQRLILVETQQRAT